LPVTVLHGFPSPAAIARRDVVTVDSTLVLLRNLIAIDSVNPSLVPGGAGESAIARVVAEEMRSFGLEVSMEDALPGRPNVVGLLRGRRPGRRLMLCGHLDTVGVGGMEDPFVPVQRGDALYGRGAGDMKGGLAAMIGAARQIAESGGLDAGELLLAAVADEEHASAGAEALVRNWTADGAIVTEPTDLQIGVVHKGFTWLDVETIGRAAHGSRPEEGRDAIFMMGRVLGRLEALDGDLRKGGAHSLAGRASLHASIIGGGQERSSYPSNCFLQIERRTLPGETPEMAAAEVEAILAELREEDLEFSASLQLVFSRPPYDIALDHHLVRTVEVALERVGRHPGKVGISFWADSAVLGAAGIPAVLFGPGGGGFHGLTEFVSVTQVLLCRDALAVAARTFCG
jgi:acetylornithine deacetylase